MVDRPSQTDCDSNRPSTSDKPLCDLEVLSVDGTPEAEIYVTALRHHYQVVDLTTRQQTALQHLQKRANVAVVVAASELDDGSAAGICREAKLKPFPTSVLVTAVNPEDIPDALVAGCDGVLLKPFPPNLLVNRVGRMVRARAEQLRLQAVRSRSSAAGRLERSNRFNIDINRVGLSFLVQSCSRRGVTSFDYASLRRTWHACLVPTRLDGEAIGAVIWAYRQM